MIILLYKWSGQGRSEHGGHSFYGLDKSLALFLRVVQGKRGAQRSYDAEPFHERLGAMVARPQGKP